MNGLTTALTIMLALEALVAVAAAVALFNRASVVDRVDFLSPTFADIQDIKDADGQVTGSLSVFFVLALAIAVVWIVWQFRHAKNAQAIRGDTGLGPGWAIGGWFIPLGNYVLPQLQLFQAAKASDPDLGPGQPAGSGKAPSSVIAWWVLLDVAVVLLGFGTQAQPSRAVEDPDKFSSAERVYGVSMLAFVAAAIIGILMVRALAARQARAGAAMSGSAQYQQPYGQQPYAYPQQPQYPAPPAYPQEQYPQQPAPPPPQQWPPPPPPPPQ